MANQEPLQAGNSGSDGVAVSALDDLPSDSYFSQQWHLHNTAAGQLDLNVADLWPLVTGSGVSAVVIDDGFDYTHPDLAPNYNSAGDYDFEEEDGDPYGDPVNDSHGTATMGLVGAARNGTGVVGVAYDAELTGFRVYSYIGDRFVSQLGRAINQAATDGADLVSMSLSSQYSGNFFDHALDPTVVAALKTALDTAVDDGRDGLGLNIVKSAGNGRHLDPQHNANLSTLNSDFRTISVAATDAEGKITFYSTPGANILVSAFGSLVPGSIVTSDRVGADGYNAGDVTTTFNGTSAATPMVAGVVALMLEANPDLGWRDVQEILASSARFVDGSNPTWAWNTAIDWNGGSRHHSVDLGFGLVDAHAAVRLAEHWTGQETSTNLVERTAGGLATPLAVPDNDPNGVTVTITQDATVGRIEFVTLRVDLPHTRAQDLVITLTSPGGTSTTLLDSNAGYADHPDSWTYTAAGFRGESGAGTWTVKVVDQAADRAGTLNDIALTLHGTPPQTDDRYLFTEEFSSLAGGSGHSTAIVDLDGGRDQVNAAALTGDSHLDLAAGSGSLDGVAVTISGIEDLIGGDGDDSLFGDSSDNTLVGGRGADSLAGRSGSDALFGGSGDDLLSISAQSEIGAGETYDGGSGSDTLILHQATSLPADAALVDIEVFYHYGSNSGDDLRGEGQEDLMLGRGGADTLRGLDGDDRLFGGTAADTLFAHGGQDRLYGDDGADSLFGGAGDDLIYGGSTGDQLAGVTGNDSLFGGQGNDKLNGGSGIDWAYGGSGSDVVTVDTAADLVFEGAGEGDHDVIRSEALSYSLQGGSGGYVEVANMISGAGPGNLTGNALRNTLGGNSATNSLSGLSGDDVLNGREGSDLMAGGSGDDTFVVDTQTDQVAELAGEGRDLVRAELDYTLPDGTATGFIEMLRLQGNHGALSGAGNGLDNVLIGNTEANSLQGLVGDDRIFGGAGDDVLAGGSGTDQLRAHSGADTLMMESGNAAFGGSGADWFLFDGSNLGSGGTGRPILRDLDGVSLGAGNGADKLVFASGLEVGSFAYVGAAAFSGGRSEARYDGSRRIEVDQDGDGTLDQAFLVDGVTDAGLLTASDFLWL